MKTTDTVLLMLIGVAINIFILIFFVPRFVQRATGITDLQLTNAFRSTLGVAPLKELPK
jgi:hypothetical protein